MKSIENKYKQTKNNVRHTMNNKEIISYLKDFSENLSILIQKDKKEIENENNNGKYENAYDLVFKPEDNYTSNHVIFLALITFHHKLGGVIECTFPPKEILNTNMELKSYVDNNKFTTTESVLDYISNNLVNYCLMDGIHLVNKDASFFIIHDFKKPLYCLSYYIQKKTDNEENKIEDSFQENIRGCIQKSICIISTLPVFGNIKIFQNYYAILSNQMTIYMNQKSLNNKGALNEIYNKLFEEYHSEKKWIFNLRKPFLVLKDDILVILKLILLEKRIIFYSQIPSNASLLIMILLSFLPGNYNNGKSFFDEQNGTPFKIFHDKYLIYPLFTLFDLDSLLEKIKNNNEINFLIGTTNKIIIENKNLNYSCLINIDEQKIQYGQDVYDDLKKLNGRETKLIKTIYHLINKDYKNKENNSLDEKNNSNNKKVKNNEDWIISNNKDDEKEFYTIKKLYLSYYLKIIYDISYLIKEIKKNMKNDPYNSKLVNFFETIQLNYLKSTSQSQNFYCSKEKDMNDLFKEGDILPHLENIISDPSTYTICSILPIKISNLISTKKTSIEKKRESILSKINNMIFISLWTKTKNFKKWFCSYKEQIIYYSTLNIEKANTELYDYDNNLYKGPLIFGKKEGTGKYDFKSLQMRYNGEFKNDLREGNGTLISYDEKFYYEGEWSNNKMEGTGVLYSTLTGKYSGKFHKDFFEGHGNLIDNEDNMYEGNFHKGEKSGKGELKLNDGKVYIGEFKNDKYHGKGVLKDSKGNIIMEGEFKNGFLVKPKKGSNKKEKNNLEKSSTQITIKERTRRKSLNPLAEELDDMEGIEVFEENEENEEEELENVKNETNLKEK